MAWSTREVAELAGTSLRTVRHYHEVGLLPVPERGPNGYKRYGVADLVQLVRIRRLVELGFTLAQVAAEPADDEQRSASLRLLDERLAAQVAELQRARAEVAELLRGSRRDPALGTALDADVDAALTDPDRAYLVVLSLVASPDVVRAYLDMLRSTRGEPVLAELDRLPPDADERVRDDLARRMAAHIDRVHAAYPLLRDTAAGAPVGRSVAVRTLRTAAEELFHPAQLDVMRRAAAVRAGSAGR